MSHNKCLLCGGATHRANIYCHKCLASEHEITCLGCGKKILWSERRHKTRRLAKFFSMVYCSQECRQKVESRSSIVSDIYNELMEPRSFSQSQSLDYGADKEEVIAENCAHIVLYALLTSLEQYYNECTSGMEFKKYLPSTQAYLLDILHYIKVIKRLLRLDYGERPSIITTVVGIDYSKDEPSDSDLRAIQKEENKRKIK